MKYQKILEYYDKIYMEDKTAFSGEPLPLVRLLAEQIKSGKILEIGAGAGRNALFLAAKGFEVTATDISPVSAALIQERATAKKISLYTKVLDITKDELDGDFDAIICTFMFHHIEGTDALVAIQKMQDHTKVGGFNVLTTFTKDGAFFRSNPGTPNFYPNKAELEHLYAGWKVLKSFEKEGVARALDAQGNKQFNIFVGLLAQKHA